MGRVPLPGNPLQEAAISTRTALVGGGGSGIGRAVADELARTGHQVVITGRRPEPLAAAATEIAQGSGAVVEPLVADVTDPASAAAAVATVVERFGSLDVLVLNAGGPPPGRVLTLDDDAWRTAFDLLLLGPLRLAREAMPGMAARGFGRIVVITSTAVRQPQPDLAASVVLRSAMTAAAKLLSLEHAADGVTVNCVAPGPVDTARRREILEARSARSGLSPQEAAAEDLVVVPAGRVGDPAEIAAAVGFLAGDAAAYVNGTVITVDGGRTETI